MSVASVTNKTLQLAELVISNEKFIGATGYVASSSSFSSSVDGTSLVSSGAISASTIALNNGGGNIDIGVVGDVGATTFDTLGTLTITRNVTDGQNEFDFIAINQTTEDCINFYASNTSVDNASTPSLKITPSGISSPVYSGGIGVTIITPTIPELTTDAYILLSNQTIPNFVGSASSIYMATPLTSSIGGFNPYSFTVGFASTSGGDTIVYLSVSNLSGGTIPSIPIQVALLAINS